MKWNSELYDSKHDFVSEYGKGLLEYLPSDPELSILDLGCGTGTLTAQLAQKYRQVIGVDSSADMIERAKAVYPDIDFRVMDALDLPFADRFDIVFSNAVFHWIPDHDALLKSIRKVLKPGGSLICEFGAKGNVATIERAFAKASGAIGYAYVSRFNFRSAEGFGPLLEQCGFAVERVCDFDRPTPLKDGPAGLQNWMRQFFAADLAAIAPEHRSAVLEQAEAEARDALWHGSEWIADYRRIRAIARKI